MNTIIKYKKILFTTLMVLFVFGVLSFITSNLVFASHEHCYKVVKIKDSTCYKEGTKHLKCKTCNAEKTKIVKKKDHNYKTYKTKKSTCTSNGTKYLKCSVCNIKKTKTIAKKEHNYKLIKTVKATYKSSGYKKYKCSNCDKIYKKTIAKLVKKSSNVGVVKFRKTNLKAPTKSDFGKYYNGAYKLYKNILNESTKPVEIVFDSANDLLAFEKKFDSKVTLSSSSIRIASGGKVDKKTGKATGTYRVDSSSYSRSKKIISYAYDACKSAGIYNGMSQKTAVKKINTWICNHMTYKINDGDAYVGFKTGYGQCMTYARMFEAMCEVCSIEATFVRGYVAAGPHDWNKVKLGSTWYYVDSCWNDTSNGVSTKYLLSKTLWSNHWLKNK